MVVMTRAGGGDPGVVIRRSLACPGMRTRGRSLRRFLEGRPVRWFVYLNAPVSRLGPVIDLGPAVAGTQGLLAVCEKVASGVPVREMIVHHRLRTASLGLSPGECRQRRVRHGRCRPGTEPGHYPGSVVSAARMWWRG